MLDQDRIFYNDFITKYNKLDLHCKTIVMMEKRPLIKYTLEQLRKLIPTIQDWHLLYYLMYKYEWDEDVINYKFKKICIIEKERINKIK